jgi:hypothetical protein
MESLPRVTSDCRTLLFSIQLTLFAALFAAVGGVFVLIAVALAAVAGFVTLSVAVRMASSPEGGADATAE